MKVSHKAILLVSAIATSIMLTACSSSELEQYQSYLEEIPSQGETVKIPDTITDNSSALSIPENNTEQYSDEQARKQIEEYEKQWQEEQKQKPIEQPSTSSNRTTSSFNTSETEYDNSRVRTTLDDGTRYRAKGSQVTKDGKVVVDISNITAKVPDPYGAPLEFSTAMANTFFITDLASGYQDNGDVAIYITGLAFKNRKYDLNNTEEYHNQMVKVGIPHTVVFKYLVKAKETYALMSYPNIGIWTAKHFSTDFNEAKAKLPDDSVYKGDNMYIDFVATSVLPHTLESKDGKYLYLVGGDRDYDDPVFRMNTGLTIFKISTNHTVKSTVMSTTIPMSKFVDDFKNEGYHHVDIHMFYPREQYDNQEYYGQIAIASVGQPDSKISTAFSVYPDTLKMSDNAFWIDRDKFMSMVED